GRFRSARKPPAALSRRLEGRRIPARSILREKMSGPATCLSYRPCYTDCYVATACRLAFDDVSTWGPQKIGPKQPICKRLLSGFRECRTSKPVAGLNKARSGFDSHTLPSSRLFRGSC